MVTDMFICAVFFLPCACALYLGWRRDRRDGVNRFGDPR